MILNTEDGLPENYIVEPLDGGTYRLVCVDNEHAFVAADATEAKQRSRRAHADLHCKSVLFCLDQMLWPLDAQVRAQLLTLDILQLLDKWTAKMVQVNTQHRALFSAAEMEELVARPADETTVVGVPVHTGLLSSLYSKLYRLQTALRRRPKITHLQLLQTLCPGLGCRYEQVLTLDVPVMQRMIVADGDSYNRKPGLPLRTNITAERYILGLGLADVRSAVTLAAAGVDHCPKTLREALPSIVRQHA